MKYTNPEKIDKAIKRLLKSGRQEFKSQRVKEEERRKINQPKTD